MAENEGVVSRALEASGGRYRLARAMPGWGRRGVEGEGKGIAEAVVRTECVIGRRKEEGKRKETEE